MKYIIRQANTNDTEIIYNVIKEAFLTAEHTDHNEHELFKVLLDSEAYIPELSLVAVLNDEIVGHILFTKIKINKTEQIALAPLSILPKYQKCGIGKTLIEKGHKIAKELGYSYSIVLGSDGYYPKFGYTKASDYNIYAPFEVPSEYFMAIKLNDELVEGTVKYAKEFGI